MDGGRWKVGEKGVFLLVLYNRCLVFGWYFFVFFGRLPFSCGFAMTVLFVFGGLLECLQGLLGVCCFVFLFGVSGYCGGRHIYSKGSVCSTTFRLF